MKIYILTKLFFKKQNPESSLHTNVLLLTSKRDIINKRITQENTEMYNYISEIMETTTGNISRRTYYFTEDQSIPSYSYCYGDFVGHLTVTEVNYEKTAEETIKENFKAGMYVTFKPDAYSFFKTTDSGLRYLQYAKVVYIKSINTEKKTATVRIRVATTEDYIDSQVNNVPLDFLKNIIL
jgi:hypothetical protein